MGQPGLIPLIPGRNTLLTLAGAEAGIPVSRRGDRGHLPATPARQIGMGLQITPAIVWTVNPLLIQRLPGCVSCSKRRRPVLASPVVMRSLNAHERATLRGRATGNRSAQKEQHREYPSRASHKRGPSRCSFGMHDPYASRRRHEAFIPQNRPMLHAAPSPVGSASPFALPSMPSIDLTTSAGKGFPPCLPCRFTPVGPCRIGGLLRVLPTLTTLPGGNTRA